MKQAVDSALIVACVVLAAAIFAIDVLLFPLGVAAAVPYVAVVLISLWLPRRQHVLYAAVAVSALTILGYFWSDPAGIWWMVLANRLLALFAIWATAMVGYQRKRTEEALQRSEYELRTIADHMPALISYVDSQQRCQFVNRGYEELFGRPESEIRGKHVSEILGTRNYESYRASIEAVLSGERLSREEAIELKDGTTRWMSIEYVPDVDPRQGVKGYFALITDITDRKRAEESLRTSEQRLSSLVETAADAIITIDSRGEIVGANRAAESIFGYAREELVGRNVSMLAPSPHRQRHDDYLAKYLGGGRPGIIGVGREVTAVRKDGKRFSIHLSVGEFSQNGHRFFTGIVRDITTAKAAQRQLSHSLEVQRAITDGSPDYVMMLDRDANIAFVNRTVPHLTVEEVLGTPIYAYVPEHAHQRMRDCFARVFETGQMDRYEVDYHSPDGEVRQFESRVGPLMQEGAVIGLVVNSTDITLRKRAEQAIRVSEARLSAFFAAAPVGMVLFDDQFRYLRINETMAGVNGLPVDDHLGKTVDQVVPKIAPLVTPLFRRIFDTGKPEMNADVSGEVPAQPGVTRHWISSHFRIPGDDPGTWALGAIVVDITDRKRAEAERERLIAELESRNVEMERFNYTVSHDLKSPLITISGFLGLLERDLATGNQERIRENLREINAATKKMEALLNDLLRLSQVGRVIDSRESVSLGELAHEAVELIVGPVAEQGILVEVSSDLPVVHGDRARLLEVLQNLVENAVKFLGDQAEPRIEIGTRQDGSETICFVSDNGIGIDPRHHEKIFGLFDRLSRETEGTGVGLTIAKRIVEAHGGRIWAESAGAGQGSTFSFAIPTRK